MEKAAELILQQTLQPRFLISVSEHQVELLKRQKDLSEMGKLSKNV